MATLKQAIELSWQQSPPLFYCRNYSCSDLPPELNAKGEKKYCSKQCETCIEVVIKQKAQTQKLIINKTTCNS